VVLTVAGVDGDVPAARDLANLRAAMVQAADAAVTLSLLPYRPALFRVVATVHADPAFSADTVRASVVAALFDRFGFTRRAIGQPVFRSDVVATIQAVPGVAWLDLDAFYRGDTPALADALFAEAPRPGARIDPNTVPIAGELLTIHPADPAITVTVP
jgi:hypothetical protein